MGTQTYLPDGGPEQQAQCDLDWLDRLEPEVGGPPEAGSTAQVTKLKYSAIPCDGQTMRGYKTQLENSFSAKTPRK